MLAQHNNYKDFSRSYTLQQALTLSPQLTHILSQAQQSRQFLNAIQHLIPESLFDAIQYGPIHNNGTWQLSLNNASAAAKIRQMLPDLLIALNKLKYPVRHIHITIKKFN